MPWHRLAGETSGSKPTYVLLVPVGLLVSKVQFVNIVHWPYLGLLLGMPSKFVTPFLRLVSYN